MNGQPADVPNRIDVLTVAAIAAIAYTAATVTHEALGHGLAAVAFGAHVDRISSVDMAPYAGHLARWQERIISAAGCVANFVVGGASLALFYRLPRAPHATYFWWLLGHLNLFIGGGYLMALSFAPFGDWNDFVQGLPNPIVWRLAFTLLGIGISLATLYHAAVSLEIFLGRSERQRRPRAVALTVAPYITGGVVETVAGMLNPSGIRLVLLSAMAASFGGAAWLVWVPFWIRKPRPDTPDIPLAPDADTRWRIAGVIALIVLVVVLGPGVPRR